MQGGKEWALDSEDANGHRVPQGNPCKRCYDVYSKSFCRYTWDELVEASAKDENRHKGAAGPFTEPEVKMVRAAAAATSTEASVRSQRP